MRFDALRSFLRSADELIPFALRAPPTKRETPRRLASWCSSGPREIVGKLVGSGGHVRRSAVSKAVRRKASSGACRCSLVFVLLGQGDERAETA
jgi:hypothetical protein